MDSDLRGPIDQSTAECPGRLETRDHDVTLGALEVLQEMMEDAPAIAHAASGDDERPSSDRIDLARLLRCFA